MASHDDNLLNDQTTGEIDLAYIQTVAPLRAIREWGDLNPPPSVVRGSVQYLQDRAMIFRRRIRAKAGLPDDTEYVAMPADLQADLSRGGVRREV